MNFNSINDYSNYYASQLILQYISKPKARGTVKSLAECLFMNFTNMGAWRNIEKADGGALMAIAELLGVSSYFDGIDLSIKYFAHEAYSQGGALLDTQEGFQDYANPKDGSFIAYADLGRFNTLANVTADILRGIIKIKRLSVLGYVSIKSIQDLLDVYFTGAYISESYAPPTVAYHVPRVYSSVFKILQQNKYLLTPPGVGALVIMED